ncbi:MAG: hypothetical protein R3C68_01235 [Myxococcota bacterium]
MATQLEKLLYRMQQHHERLELDQHHQKHLDRVYSDLPAHQKHQQNKLLGLPTPTQRRQQALRQVEQAYTENLQAPNMLRDFGRKGAQRSAIHDESGRGGKTGGSQFKLPRWMSLALEPQSAMKTALQQLERYRLAHIWLMRKAMSAGLAPERRKQRRRPGTSLSETDYFDAGDPLLPDDTFEATNPHFVMDVSYFASLAVGAHTVSGTGADFFDPEATVPNFGRPRT